MTEMEPAAPAALAVLVVGAGVVGARVARQWAAREGEGGGGSGGGGARARVTAWTRSPASAFALRAEGLRAEAVDITRAGERLPVDPAGYDLVYFCAAPRLGADAQAVYVDGYRRVFEALEACRRPPARVVLAGSTGVIGDAGGAAVDESCARETGTPRAATLCACEDLFTAWAAAHAATGGHAVILRLCGLYGPERNPLAALKAGTYRYPRDPERGINLIHVTDAAAALVAAGRLNVPPESAGAAEIIHVSDGQFPTRREYLEAICAQYDLPLPPPPAAEDASRAPGTSSRGVGDRRISNEKMRRLLLPELAFPSYREGLASFEFNVAESG